MTTAYGVGDADPHYGAAVLTTKGNIYSAGQYKAGSRQISLHAEQAALVHAAAHGEHQIHAIAIVSNEDGSGEAFTNPCGICKQALYESSLDAGVPMEVILANAKGDWVVKSLDEFIVYPWPNS
jgi:cytidine deaminase